MTVGRGHDLKSSLEGQTDTVPDDDAAAVQNTVPGEAILDPPQRSTTKTKGERVNKVLIGISWLCGSCMTP